MIIPNLDTNIKARENPCFLPIPAAFLVISFNRRYYNVRKQINKDGRNVREKKESLKMSDKMNDGLKKVAYTGIGLAAMSVDMLGKAVETLAARGEEAVQKGKVMNEELKRRRSAAKEDVKDIADALEKMTKEEIASLRIKLSGIEKKAEETGKEVKLTAEAIAASLKEMSREEIDSIRAKLEEIRMNWIDKSDEGEES